MKGAIRDALITSLRRLTGRRPYFLPPEADADEALLPVTGPYRVEGGTLPLVVQPGRPGTLAVTVRGYEGHFPTRVLGGGSAAIAAEASVAYQPRAGTLEIAGQVVAVAPLDSAARRFVLELVHRSPGGERRRRTSHYLPGSTITADADYFSGANYVDHEAESAGEVAQVATMVAAHGVRGPVLEVGAATGAQVAALRAAGIAAIGVDYSSWAVTRAAERLGPESVWQADVEREGLPAAVRAKGPFAGLVCWATLEHFRQPFAVLAQLAEVAAPGALLFVRTTNSDSLSHALYGAQWEGYFDATHHGVDAVSVRSIRHELPRAGWRLRSLHTDLFWDSCLDSTRSALRELHAHDARFRALLAERDLGDFVTFVAERA